MGWGWRWGYGHGDSAGLGTHGPCTCHHCSLCVHSHPGSSWQEGTAVCRACPGVQRRVQVCPAVSRTHRLTPRAPAQWSHQCQWQGPARGQRVPPAPAPAAAPPHGIPCSLRGLHLCLGQTPAKWAVGGGRGGCISKAPAAANAAAPPPGSGPPTPPDPRTARPGWGGSPSPAPAQGPAGTPVGWGYVQN